MIVRVNLEQSILKKCYEVALERNNIKNPRTNQQVSSRPGHELHYDGLRAEAAVAQYLAHNTNVDYSVKRNGDDGSDLTILGLKFQVKAVTYSPPFLRFNMSGSQTFKSDAAVVALVPSVIDAKWVDIWGWVSHEDFFIKASKQNFGYGDRWVMKPPFNPIEVLKQGLEIRKQEFSCDPV